MHHNCDQRRQEQQGSLRNSQVVNSRGPEKLTFSRLFSSHSSYPSFSLSHFAHTSSPVQTADNSSSLVTSPAGTNVQDSKAAVVDAPVISQSPTLPPTKDVVDLPDDNDDKKDDASKIELLAKVASLEAQLTSAFFVSHCVSLFPWQPFLDLSQRDP